MIKKFGSVEQLSELTVEQLCKLSEKCHIRSAKDIETDDASLFEFKKFMKSQTSIGSLIDLLVNEGCKINWDYEPSTSKNLIIVNGKKFKDEEFQVCLWQAVKFFVLGIKEDSSKNFNNASKYKNTTPGRGNAYLSLKSKNDNTGAFPNGLMPDGITPGFGE